MALQINGVSLELCYNPTYGSYDLSPHLFSCILWGKPTLQKVMKLSPPSRRCQKQKPKQNGEFVYPFNGRNGRQPL